MAHAKTRVWFRNDLRLADNPALTAACADATPYFRIFNPVLQG
jgi:deoxyribodipyrimidine photolyase